MTPAVINGVVQAVDAKNRSITVSFKNGKKETFTVDKDADVRIKQRRTTLSEIPVGVPASLSLSYRAGRLVGVRSK